jgi:hypothetical protein
MDERQLVNIAVAESPTSAFRPVSPKPLLNAALGLLTALFLAAGAVYFAEYLRTTVATARELEMTSRYPVLATVPYAVEAEIGPRTRTPPTRGYQRVRAIRFSVHAPDPCHAELRQGQRNVTYREMRRCIQRDDYRLYSQQASSCQGLIYSILQNLAPRPAAWIHGGAGCCPSSRRHYLPDRSSYVNC